MRIPFTHYSGAFRTFIRLVPDDLVLDFFKCVGYKTLDDESVFSKNNITDIVKEQMDNLILILFPYYRRNMQYKITRNADSMYYIKILRNLAQNSCMIMKSFHKDYKPIVYRLINPQKSKSMLPPINCEVAKEVVLEILPKKRKLKTIVNPEFVRVIVNHDIVFS